MTILIMMVMIDSDDDEFQRLKTIISLCMLCHIYTALQHRATETPPTPRKLVRTSVVDNLVPVEHIAAFESLFPIATVTTAVTTADSAVATTSRPDLSTTSISTSFSSTHTSSDSSLLESSHYEL